MSVNFESGFGSGSTGYYNVPIGLPANKPVWYKEKDWEREHLISLHSFCHFESDTFYWRNRHDLVAINVNSGEEEEFFRYVEKRGLETQISISNNFLLAGPTLLDKQSFQKVASFEEEIGVGRTTRNTELVVVPVSNGFIYLGGRHISGQSKPPITPRPLWHIHAEEHSIRQIADDVTSFVMLPNSDVYFAMRSGNLVCERWATGERVWEQPLQLQWDEQVTDRQRASDDISRVSLLCSASYVYLHRPLSGIYIYCSDSGEHQGRVEDTVLYYTSKSLLQSPDQVLIADNIIYQFFVDTKCYGSSIRAVSAETRQVIYELDTPDAKERIFFIAGDLIYGIDERRGKVLARDRFSGEIVWEGPNLVPYLMFGVPVDNKVLFYSGTGPMACWEWEVPYSSPHKCDV